MSSSQAEGVPAAALPAPPPLGAYALLAASMALVGTYVGLSKVLVAVFPVFLLAWLRFALAAAAIPHWLWRRSAAEPPMDRASLRLLAVQSLFGNVLFSAFMLYGVKWSSALTAGVVMATIPAAVALLSRAWLKERLDGRTGLAIALAVAGVAMLSQARLSPEAATSDPGHPTWQQLAGPLMLAAAVFCEAVYVVIGKRLVAGLSARRVSAWLNLWGLVLVTPLGLWQAVSFDFAAVGGRTWALFGFYALAASVFSVWLWMKGLHRVPASKAGICTVFLPIAAASVGVVALGETFTALHALALGLALAGVIVGTWPSE